MKKLIFITIALVMLIGVTQAQTPRSIMAGGLFQGGDRSFAFAVATTVPVMTVGSVQDYGRMGYIYSNSTDQLQGIFAMNYLEKTMKENAFGGRWYAAQGEGVLFEIEDGEDKIAGAFSLETGLQFGETVKLGIGVTYEPIFGLPDRTFAYLHIDLFPRLF